VPRDRRAPGAVQGDDAEDQPSRQLPNGELQPVRRTRQVATFPGQQRPEAAPPQAKAPSADQKGRLKMATNRNCGAEWDGFKHERIERSASARCGAAVVTKQIA